MEHTSFTVSVEYLDTKRIPYTSTYADLMAGHLARKYEEFQPSAIYVTDDNATSFALSHLMRIFPNTPTFFSGVNNYGLRAEFVRDRITGVFEQKEIGPNLELMRQLAPSNRDILVVGDETETFDAIRSEIEVELSRHPGIRAHFVSSNRLDLLTESLRGRPERFVFLTTLGAVKDAGGRMLDLADIISSIRQSGSYTILSMEDVYIYDGVLGGYVTSGTKQGQAAAKMVGRYLRGTGVAGISPIESSPNQYVFDAKELARTGLRLPSKIARQATILNPPSGFYERHLDAIVHAFYATVLLFVSLLSVSLYLVVRKNRRIHESETRHRLLFERSPDGHLILEDGVFTDCNNAILSMLGATRSQVIGQSPAILSPERQPDGSLSVESATARIDQTMETGSARFEWMHCRLDGTEFWVDVSLATIPMARRPAILATWRNITDRKLTEERLRTATRAKSEFLANMSHEIRTPMTAILGFTDLMLDSATTPEAVDAAKTVKRNGEHLLGVINNILDLSKIEADKLETEMVDCSPLEILRDVSDLMKVPATAKGLTLELRSRGKIPRTIRSDPTRLRQILINLVGNAIKFTEVGSVLIEYSHNVDKAGEPKLEVRISDTGIGMPGDLLSRLFLPFSQADTSMARQYGGSGLGLAISKRLATLLGGDIEVESAPGMGSIFTITVSAGPLDSMSLSDSPREAQASKAPKSKPTAPRIELDARVLLAEDGLDNQRLVSFLLKKAGAEVTVAENGQIAHDLALAARDEGNPFDVILMDMQMPIMDGYETTVKLREAGYDGPIIALTAHAMSTDRDKCMAAGCDGYSTKPIDREELLAVVAEYTGGQTLHKGNDTPTA